MLSAPTTMPFPAQGPTSAANVMLWVITVPQPITAASAAEAVTRPARTIEPIDTSAPRQRRMVALPFAAPPSGPAAREPSGLGQAAEGEGRGFEEPDGLHLDPQVVRQ